MEKVKGEAKIPVLKGRESNLFLTSEVKLHQQALDGGYYYVNGGQANASDSVLGVWVKLFNGNTEVAEYVNPGTMKTKFKWE